MSIQYVHCPCKGRNNTKIMWLALLSGTAILVLSGDNVQRQMMRRIGVILLEEEVFSLTVNQPETPKTN